MILSNNGKLSNNPKYHHHSQHQQLYSSSKLGLLCSLSIRRKYRLLISLGRRTHPMPQTSHHQSSNQWHNPNPNQCNKHNPSSLHCPNRANLSNPHHNHSLRTWMQADRRVWLRLISPNLRHHWKLSSSSNLDPLLLWRDAGRNCRGLLEAGDFVHGHFIIYFINYYHIT